MNRHPSLSTNLNGSLKKNVYTECFESHHVLLHHDAGSIFDLSHSESAVVSSSMLVELLINLVRERPAIYDSSDPNHRDRDVIAALWKDVAAALSCTGKTSFIHFEPFIRP